jgi:hypothetical protein
MSDESKKFALDVLRREFIKFMEAVSKIPGAPIQKQQAFLRFDEGHMWMQNAVVTYVEPPENPAPDAQLPGSPDTPSPDDLKPLSPEEQAALPAANPADVPVLPETAAA